jgi:hypothetical protein
MYKSFGSKNRANNNLFFSHCGNIHEKCFVEKKIFKIEKSKFFPVHAKKAYRERIGLAPLILKFATK